MGGTNMKNSVIYRDCVFEHFQPVVLSAAVITMNKTRPNKPNKLCFCGVNLSIWDDSKFSTAHIRLNGQKKRLSSDTLRPHPVRTFTSLLEASMDIADWVMTFGCCLKKANHTFSFKCLEQGSLCLSFGVLSGIVTDSLCLLSCAEV